MENLAEVCPKCEGTGWKRVSGGAETRVTRCDCRLRSRGDTLLAAARIPKRYEHCELSNFDYDGNIRLRGAFTAANRFVSEYPLNKTGLLFVGNAGIGKTHLAVAIARTLIQQKGIACVFYDYAELLKQIQDSYNPDVNTTELGLLRPVFETEVVVLDDLGSVKPTDWRWDTIRLILNTRYNASRTTIITTNFEDRDAMGISDLDTAQKSDRFRAAQAAARKDTLGDRIGNTMRSRLHEMCRVVRMAGPDYRQEIKNAMKQEIS
jgi:DNA replication protein DnaC